MPSPRELPLANAHEVKLIRFRVPVAAMRKSCWWPHGRKPWACSADRRDGPGRQTKRVVGPGFARTTTLDARFLRGAVVQLSLCG